MILHGYVALALDVEKLANDLSQSPEAAVIQLFEEVKRHKPSIIYLPDVEMWYRTLSDSVIKTFCGLLRSIPPTEPVLLLGYTELEKENASPDSAMLRDLFGYSLKNQYDLTKPSSPERGDFFEQIIAMIRKAPTEFPDESNRKRRKLAILPLAPEAGDAGPHEPSKAEQKAQKKKDRQTLNLLKLNIQSVMDQIKLKYKKFRTPVVDEMAITYLFDEQDPNVLTTDLTEEQRAEQALYRPYEIEQDEKGIQGLREVATGKFYYNLEIVTIEKRLSNGYYKRPKDYLADIKRLAKDARQCGDQDRTLKANEMFANVEVDMTTLEQQQPLLVAECEAVYEREQARERERQRKAGAARADGLPIVLQKPNVPPQHASKTTTEGSGPVVLGQEVPGPPQLFPVTPSRLSGPSPISQQWSTTNGHSHNGTNGSHMPSRQGEDSEMLDASPHAFSTAHPYPANNADYHHNSQFGTNPNAHRSQRSAHTQLAHNSQLSQYHNSASTTTSGQKTSDRSNRSSGPYTQFSNGMYHRNDHPAFGTLEPASGGSQLPDTQDANWHSSQSQPGSQPSQQQQNQLGMGMGKEAMPPPALQSHRSSVGGMGMGIQQLLNEPSNPTPATTHDAKPSDAKPPSYAGATTTTTAATTDLPPPQRIILDARVLSDLHTELTKRSSGLSVEQLEQVNAALMQAVWELRAEWNRNKCCQGVMSAFNEVVGDIEECQRVLKASQEEEEAQRY